MRVWVACSLCAGQPGRDHMCSLCQGAGGWWDGHDDNHWGGGGGEISGDDRLAALLGILVGGLLAYMAYIRGGFGGDPMWDFVIPIGSAFVAAKIFSKMTWLLSAIRWTVKAALWVGLAVVIYYFVQGSESRF